MQKIYILTNISDVSEIVETRLVTLTELETFQRTIYSQYTDLKSTIDTATLITVTQNSHKSVLTYSYEVGPGGVGWVIPAPSNGEPLPSEPSDLPWTMTRLSSTETSTGLLGPIIGLTTSISSSSASSRPTAITGTITSLPTGFTAVELPGTTYSGNDWVTTTDSQHHPTLLPLITIGGGRGIVFWDLPPIPNVEFIFPKFPNLPSLPKIHLPCVKVFGIHISGDCSEPPESDGPSDSGGNDGSPKSNDPPSKTQPPDSQPTNNQPSDSQPTKSQPTKSQPTKSEPMNSQPTKSQTSRSQPTTSHTSSKSDTSSSSSCSTYVTVSNCQVTCASTATSSSCASWGTTCSQTSSRCSVEGTTSTASTSAAVCSIEATATASSGKPDATGQTDTKSAGSRTTANTARPIISSPIKSQTQPTTFETSTIPKPGTISATACVKVTIVDCIYNYETVSIGQPCPTIPVLPATCTGPLPFAGGSGVASPTPATTTMPVISTPTLSGQYCYPSGAFGRISDINSEVQNQTTEQACEQLAPEALGIPGKQSNWQITANNGGEYNYNIFWSLGCRKPSDATTIELQNVCVTAMRNNYLNCKLKVFFQIHLMLSYLILITGNNGGIGGYISYGCYILEFTGSFASSSAEPS